MSWFDVLITLGILVGLGKIWSLVRKSWGRVEGVQIQIGNPTPLRTRGEVNRELWEQKSALDRAEKAAAKVQKLQAKTATSSSWHAPDAPCEVEQ